MRTGDRGGGSEMSERWDVREVKKDRCKFHISMKFENIEVSSARPRSGCGVSKDDIRGMRKFCSERWVGLDTANMRYPPCK